MPMEHLNLITKLPDEAEAVINQLFVNPDMKATKWYPAPETCSEPDKLNAIERRMYDEILALQELAKLDPSKSHEQRMNFLKSITGGRIASHTGSTNTGREVAGKVQLHFC